MSEFHSAKGDFSLLIEKHGFAYIPALWEVFNMILVRKYTHNDIDYFCYVIARANGSGGLCVKAWVSALEVPDGRLEMNPTSIEIIIDEQWDLKDDILLKCQNKIINLLPSISSAGYFIESELKEPTLFSRSNASTYKSNTYERLLVKAIQQSSSYSDIEKAIVQALKKEESRIPQVSELVQDYLKQYRDQFSEDIVHYVDVMDNSVLKLSDTLADLLYIDKAASLAADKLV